MNATVVRIAPRDGWRIREDISGVVNPGIKFPVRPACRVARGGAVVVGDPGELHRVPERNRDRTRNEVRPTLAHVDIRRRGPGY